MFVRYNAHAYTNRCVVLLNKHLSFIWGTCVSLTFSLQVIRIGTLKINSLLLYVNTGDENFISISLDISILSYLSFHNVYCVYVYCRYSFALTLINSDQLRSELFKLSFKIFIQSAT